MSRSKRRSDNTAPALFPFLAVLLCTIGALVLILVITVTHSHASARRDAENAISEVKESAEIMQSVSEDLEAQREILRKKVDRRRKELADIEDHITRLAKNLEQLAERIEHIQAEASETEASKAEKNQRVEQLRQEIDSKKRELVDEIEKQKKRRPAFAIIPYSGAHGTSRRPVYLECTRDGVLIQPEGLLVSTNELRPPLGPGNPLDAALRVLRLAYQQKDATFGITQPPYPLLLVRPDGIHTYALAREAMSGWDDQFGYELIDGDMELKFPASVSGLKEQLTTTVEVAKRRQLAILASMPRHVVGPETDESWDSIDAAGGPTSTTPGGSPPSGNSATGGSFGNGSAIGTGADSEWRMVQGLANSQLVGTIQKNGTTSGGYDISSSGGSQGNALTPRGMPIPADAERGELAGEYQVAPGTNPTGTNLRAPSGLQTGNGNGSDSGDGRSAPQSNATSSDASSASDGNANGAASGNANGGSSGGSAGGTAAGGNAQQGSKTPNGSSPSDPRMNALSNGSAIGGGNSMQSAGSTAQPSNDPNASPNVSLSMNKEINDSSPSKPKHVKQEGDLKPIAVSAGKGWAASRAEGKATPVSRPITVVALKDRWLLRSDVDPMKFEETITMDEGPQQAGNQLATVLKKRVDSWGLAVTGGFWSPSLTIEAASDAQQSVTRLERLLEGSGVEIKVVPLKLPKRR